MLNRAREMAQWVKALAQQPENQSLILGTNLQR